MVGRSGGEEFVVVAPETPLADALAVAERLRAEVARADIRIGELSVQVTISGGVASLRSARAHSPDELLAVADAALYRAKALGRNRVETAPAPENLQPVIQNPETGI